MEMNLRSLVPPRRAFHMTEGRRLESCLAPFRTDTRLRPTSESRRPRTQVATIQDRRDSELDCRVLERSDDETAASLAGVPNRSFYPRFRPKAQLLFFRLLL